MAQTAPHRSRSWTAGRLRSSAGHWLHILATLGCAATLTILMVVGMQRADELQAAATTLQMASELAGRPQTLRTELTLVQRELETTAYVGDSLRTVARLRATSEQGPSPVHPEQATHRGPPGGRRRK